MKIRSGYQKNFLVPILAGSLAVHGTILGLSGLVELSPRYEVERAVSSVEVILLKKETEIPEPQKKEVVQEILQTEAASPDIVEVREEVEAINQEEPEEIPQEDLPEPVKTEPALANPPDQGALVPAVPDEIKNKAPEYPYIARQRGWEGTVLLSVRVLASGRAEKIEIMQSSGHKVLDQAAWRAVKLWRFQPAHVGGLAITSAIEIPIRFVLKTS